MPTTEQGTIIVVAVLLLAVVGYYFMQPKPDTTLAQPVPPKVLDAGAGGFAPKARAGGFAPKARAATGTRGMTMGERTRVRVDGKNVFGPAVAQMQADMARRQKGSAQMWAPDGSDNGTGYTTIYGEQDSSDRLLNALPQSVRDGQANYVAELQRTKGTPGSVNLHGGYGVEFDQAPQGIRGIWPLLRGVREAPKHGYNNGPIDSVSHSQAEDGFARHITRAQYTEDIQSGNTIAPTMASLGKTRPARAGDALTRSSI